jgi:SAM-dependent methyltransferase
MNSYKKLCTEFYDTDKPNPPRAAMEFYLRYAQQATGPLLEPMCGSGRFLIPLLERGFDIEGTDASPHMLQACRENARKRGLSPLVHQQFLHELDLPRKFGLIFIPAGSFGLIERIQARESLERMHALMLPGAKLLLEVSQHRPEASYNGPWGGRWVQRSDGAKIIISWLTHYDSEKRYSQSIHRYDLIKDGQLIETEFEDFGGPAYDKNEICDMLEAANFQEIKILKAHAQQPPDQADENIVIECAKH